MAITPEDIDLAERALDANISSLKSVRGVVTVNAGTIHPRTNDDIAKYGLIIEIEASEINNHGIDPSIQFDGRNIPVFVRIASSKRQHHLEGGDHCAFALENDFIDGFCNRNGPSIGWNKYTGGTIGACFDGDDGKRYLISCSHTIGKSGGAVAGKIVSTNPHFNVYGGFDIARLVRCTPVVPGTRVLVDAAVAELNPGSEMISRGIRDSIMYQKTVAITDPVLKEEKRKWLRGRKVFKRGFASRTTCGTVSSVKYTKGLGGVEYYDQLLVVTDSGGPFSIAGDSGSLVYDAITYEVVGMVVGGDTTHSDGTSPCESVVTFIHDVLPAVGLTSI